MKNETNFSEQIKNQLLDQLNLDPDYNHHLSHRVTKAIDKISQILDANLPILEDLEPDGIMLFPYPANYWGLDSSHDAQSISILLDKSDICLENDEPIQKITKELNFTEEPDENGGSIWVTASQINLSLMLITISYQY